MSWIQQNKFLSGFIAFMLVGVVLLGYLLIREQARYGEARTEYETKTAELRRLEGLKPYPEDGNLKEIEAQKAQHIAAIDTLRKNIAATQIPVEPLERKAFQDKLREAVTRITTKAKEGGMALPTPFYLGMDKYQTEPPIEEAAPALGHQLKALELVVTKMIDDGIIAIGRFERDLLPEEEGKARKEKDAPAKPGVPPGKGEKSGKDLVTYHGVQIEFTAEQSRFRNFLNGIVAEKAQFFVPRLVVVKNDLDAAPARVVPGAPGAVVASPPVEKKDKLVFGNENVTVALVLDIVDFAEVAAK